MLRGGNSSFTEVMLSAGRGAGLILNVSPDTGAASNSSARMLKLQHLKINTVSILAVNVKKMMPYMI